MNQKNIELANSLHEIENELRRLGEWKDSKPSDESLMSTEPFSVDKLSPSEWLQWIFIPKMNYLITNQIAIPLPFSIAQYFEESYKDERDKESLIQALQRIDRVVNGL